eukprot:3633267-Rhodomonas_salina.2
MKARIMMMMENSMENSKGCGNANDDDAVESSTASQCVSQDLTALHLHPISYTTTSTSSRLPSRLHTLTQTAMCLSHSLNALDITGRIQTQETAFMVQIVLRLRFPVFHFGV